MGHCCAERELGPDHISLLLLEAFHFNIDPVLDPVKNSITEFGCAILERSQRLLPTNLRAGKLVKLLSCAIMCISEYNEGGFKQEAEKIEALCRSV